MNYMTITVDRYTQLAKAECDLKHISEYLTRKLKTYAGVSHEELEMLCILGYIKEPADGSDT